MELRSFREKLERHANGGDAISMQTSTLCGEYRRWQEEGFWTRLSIAREWRGSYSTRIWREGTGEGAARHIGEKRCFKGKRKAEDRHPTGKCHRRKKKKIGGEVNTLKPKSNNAIAEKTKKGESAFTWRSELVTKHQLEEQLPE